MLKFKPIFCTFALQNYTKYSIYLPTCNLKTKKIMTETAELIDNEFLRQYELKVEDEMAIIEYSLQERKIFLTKLLIPETIESVEFKKEFLEMVFNDIKERNISMVPTSPEIAKFVRGNRRYKRMLPVGIRI